MKTMCSSTQRSAGNPSGRLYQVHEGAQGGGREVFRAREQGSPAVLTCWLSWGPAAPASPLLWPPGPDRPCPVCLTLCECMSGIPAFDTPADELPSVASPRAPPSHRATVGTATIPPHHVPPHPSPPNLPLFPAQREGQV
ncbi:unnamed protein product [Arctogadus glacialis]